MWTWPCRPADERCGWHERAVSNAERERADLRSHPVFRPSACSMPRRTRRRRSRFRRAALCSMSNTPALRRGGTRRSWQRQADPRSVAMERKGRVVGHGTNSRSTATAWVLQDGSTKQVRKYFPMASPSAGRSNCMTPRRRNRVDRQLLCRDHNQFRRTRHARLRPGRCRRLARHVEVDKTRDGAASQDCPPSGHQRRRQDLHRRTEPKEAVDPTKDHPNRIRNVTRLASARPMGAYGARVWSRTTRRRPSPSARANRPRHARPRV